jgi:hypothetical protein
MHGPRDKDLTAARSAAKRRRNNEWKARERREEVIVPVLVTPRVLKALIEDWGQVQAEESRDPYGSGRL